MNRILTSLIFSMAIAQFSIARSYNPPVRTKVKLIDVLARDHAKRNSPINVKAKISNGKDMSNIFLGVLKKGEVRTVNVNVSGDKFDIWGAEWKFKTTDCEVINEAGNIQWLKNTCLTAKT